MRYKDNAFKIIRTGIMCDYSSKQLIKSLIFEPDIRLIVFDCLHRRYLTDQITWNN